MQLIRDEMFKFKEEQRINKGERYSHSSCVNMVLEALVTAQRSASLHAHPNNPQWTVFEQKMSISISNVFGSTIKAQLESFAESMFVSAAKSGTAIMEQSLARERDRLANLSDQANGGGVWWTGGDQTLPFANLQRPEPQIPQDSSSGWFSDTVEALSGWMWASSFSSKSYAETTRSTSTSKSGSVWWDNGAEWSQAVAKSIIIDTGRSEISEQEPHAVIGAASDVTSSAAACPAKGKSKAAAGRSGERLIRRPLQRIASLARHAGSAKQVKLVLAGIAVQVVSAGHLHFGEEHGHWKEISTPETQNEGRVGAGPLGRLAARRHPKLAASTSSRLPQAEPPSFQRGRDFPEATQSVGAKQRTQVPRFPLRHGLGAAAGAAAAFVST